jgi:UDP-glucose 4-epimerase
MRLLITGGAGYVGTHLLLELLPLGHDICVVDNFSNSTRESLQRVKMLAGFDFEIQELDLCDYGRLISVCNAFKPQTVIHLAGLKAVSESVSSPVHYFDKNIGGSIQLLKAMDKCECRTIIFSSSATVYAQQSYPIDELQPVKPGSPYGRTKYFIESLIHDWTKTHSQKSAVILRYFNPVGAHNSGQVGEDPSSEPNNLMPLILQVASGQRTKIDVFGGDYDTKDGTAVRDYVHVLDLANGHLAGLRFALTHTGSEIFNIGTGLGYSVLDVIEAFETSTGKTIKYEIASRRPGDVCISVANADKARSVLKWSPCRGLGDMCRDAWSWHSKNPEGYRK